MLAGFQHRHRLIGVVVRRQGQNHAVDRRIGQHLIDLHGPDPIQVGQRVGAVLMAIAYGVKRAEFGKCPGVVRSPIAAADNGDFWEKGALHG